MAEEKHKVSVSHYSSLDPENLYGPAKEDSERAQLFKIVFDAAPNGIIVVSQEGRILLNNSCASRIFGYSNEEFKTLTVEDLIPTRFRTAHLNHRYDFKKNPETRKMGVGRDLFAIRRNGTEFPLEVGLNPIHIDGQIMVLCSIIDITERKQSEMKLKHYADELEAVNSELSEYTYVVSHDLRAPLRAIRNYADFLKEDIEDQLQSAQKEYLKGLLHAVKQADKMVTDLLSLSRIGKKIEKPEEVDVYSILNNIYKEFAVDEDIEIKVEKEWPRIKSDPTILHQIFSNLISNSIKFNSSSPKKIEISWQDPGDKYFEFYVKDNGIGIDPKYQKQIFKVFERLHSTTEYEGTGIGLAIVKKAAAKIRGSIRIESEKDKGTTFFIRIPKTKE